MISRAITSVPFYITYSVSFKLRMKGVSLYLHIGTEKTGSSYLQTLLARNRHQLQNNGIHFPALGKRDQDMLAGKISPGNGKALYQLLSSHDDKGVRRHLSELKESAVEANCKVLLLSNELLLLPLSKPGRFSSFEKLTREIGFAELRVLLFLRDPVDQALSLYKHRAKRGNVPNIGEWVKSGYSLDQSLQNFIANIGKSQDAVCTLRKYRKDTDYIVKVFFQDWLATAEPEHFPQQDINPSLSLSELFFIKALRDQNEELSRIYYDRMLAIPKLKKVKDERLENYIKQILNQYLSRKAEVWDKCNQHLAKDEQLRVPTEVSAAEASTSLEQVLIFSTDQAVVIADLMNDCLSLSFRVKLLMNYWWRRGSRIKRRLLGLAKSN